METNQKNSGSELIDSKRENGIPWKIYISRCLSAWGDRMWAFGGGVFMTKLDQNESLRLVAIYGFVISISVILFGAPIGNWIDRNRRLLAAKLFLFIQNISVTLCCVLLGLYFWKEDDLLDKFGTASTYFVAVVVILIADVANLASVGSKIVVEKDWIIVIASGNRNRLANINAVFRTLDLTCFVLAPIIAGFLFQFLRDI